MNNNIKWCPGCGNFSIFKQMNNALQDINIPKKDIVFVSGIGCSSRFPYYMNTFGIHGIHGRAPAIATGIKLTNPNLSVWVITGDGDALSIGGNHLIHAIRRNININILLFNNEIYGLTKGQFSPTSKVGLKKKSFINFNTSINPLDLALSSHGTFIARSIDSNVKHLKQMIIECHNHKGTSFLEIYQNCNIFNDKAFIKYKNSKNMIFLEHKKPLLFNNDKTIVIDNFKSKIKYFDKKMTNLWIHDYENIMKASLLIKLIDNQHKFPKLFGIIYKNKKPCYEENFNKQI